MSVIKPLNPPRKGVTPYQKCVIDLKKYLTDETSEDPTELEEDELITDVAKWGMINKTAAKYFNKEEPDGVYNGFFRLLLEMHSFATELGETIRVMRRLMAHIMGSFHGYLQKDEDCENDSENSFETEEKIIELKMNILESVPHNDEIYIRTFDTIAYKMKPKHVKIISIVFGLGLDESDMKLKLKAISHMMELRDWPNAIRWIVFFQLKDHFVFEEVVCRLLLDNAVGTLELFIGDDKEQQTCLIKYLDRIIGGKLRDDGTLTELESRVTRGKNVEKAVAKLLRTYCLSDSMVPNALGLRARECLMFHHYAWAKDSTSGTSDCLESMALQAMSVSSFVRDHYLNYLCKQKMQKCALYYAVQMQLDLNVYPNALKTFCLNFPVEADNTLAFVTEENARRLRIYEVEEKNGCGLELQNGKVVPIHLVDNFIVLNHVMETISKEKIVGVDAEWKPPFVSMNEQVALIQISTPKEIFLIDVAVLENELSPQQWLLFFRSLFCSETLHAIGYDFRNDLNVLKNTFPYISALAPETKNIMCLFKLLKEATSIPEASELIFGDEPPVKNLNLAEVSKMFLNIEMDKSERVGNWLQRPLRDEQKKYAALDAYCVGGIFYKITKILPRLTREVRAELLSAAMLPIEEKSRSPELIED